MASLRDVALLRLRNQRLIGRGFASAAEVVGWFGALQSQDYAGAKWAVGQRMARATDAAVERAFAAGEILRTHVLRPTWHFVVPEDIRWLLELTAPRVRAAVRYHDEQLGLDAASFARAQAALRRALDGEHQLTRAELGRVLDAQGQHLGQLLMHAELDGLICSGPRRGKQFTYALLAERVPKAAARTREEALTELTLRYFTSHGPALPQDFAWWSGLTVADARAGIELAGGQLREWVADGRSYWLAGDVKPPRLRAPVVHLLPNYDENLIAFKERSAIFDPAHVKKLGPREMLLGNHLITLDGRVIGGWRRESARPGAPFELTLLVKKLSAAEQQALKAAQQRLLSFLEAAEPARARARRA